MADRQADFVYADDSKETVDIINLLLLGWILLGLVVYILGNVIATQIRKRKLKERGEKSAECSEPLCSETAVKKSAELHAAAAVDEEYSEDFLPCEPTKPLLVPLCNGVDADLVKWINNVFSWIYVQRIVSPILESWLFALNAKTRLLSTEHGILINFQSVVQSKEPPHLSEAYESISPKDKMIVSCQAEIMHLSFDILVTQVKEKEKHAYKFLLNLDRLAGQLSIQCDPEDLSFRMRFPERPQVQLEVEPSPTTPIPPEEYELLHSLICEIASEAFASSSIDLQLSSFPECPRYAQEELAANEDNKLHEDEKEEKLLVKIAKAVDLGGKQGCSKPYCIVEMDEPTQRFETKPVDGGSNPIWDESFVFVIRDISAELLFEVYDRDCQPEKFLGLGIVSVEELLTDPSQRQVIPLQSRPLEKDEVTGSLTAEFLLLSCDFPAPEVQSLPQNRVDEQPGKIIETNSRVTAGGTIITTTTIKRTKEDVADLTNTALKQLEKQEKPGSPSVSTLIIHSVQKEVIQPTMKVKKDKSGKWQEVAELESSGTDSLEASPASHLSVESRSSPHLSLPPSPSIHKNGIDRSRPKDKKSLITNLRKKLSFRKTRSRSMEQQRLESSPIPIKETNRSISTERVKGHSGAGDSASLKSGRPLLAVPASSRSSFSEASGLSTASSRTYINENSTLVIELNENGIIKRYLIPTSMIHRSKWKKKGIKLHLYNDHVFVAKHMSGSTMCQVCKKFLTRRPGKQGYECRDCNLQCHKSCHVKVGDYCPNSSVSSMEVEYVHDPRLAKPKSA